MNVNDPYDVFYAAAQARMKQGQIVKIRGKSVRLPGACTLKDCIEAGFHALQDNGFKIHNTNDSTFL